MIVCSCNVISDHDIRDIVLTTDIELSSTAQVYDCLGCSVRCGLCSHSVRRILAEQAGGRSQYLEVSSKRVERTSRAHDEPFGICP